MIDLTAWRILKICIRQHYSRAHFKNFYSKENFTEKSKWTVQVGWKLATAFFDDISISRTNSSGTQLIDLSYIPNSHVPLELVPKIRKTFEKKPIIKQPAREKRIKEKSRNRKVRVWYLDRRRKGSLSRSLKWLIPRLSKMQDYSADQFHVAEAGLFDFENKSFNRYSSELSEESEGSSSPTDCLC